MSRQSGDVCAGHGRLAAARLAGLDSVPVNYQSFKTEAEEIEFLIADNRLAELSDTDEHLLAELVKNCPGIDAAMTGYDPDALQKLIDTDPAAELAGAIRSEQEHHANDAPDPQAVIDGLSGHIQRLAEQHPERLKDAVAVILPAGRGHTRDCLILARSGLCRCRRRTRRHVDAGEKSPVASLLSALLPMGGDA